MKLLTTQQIINKYGKPGDESNIVTIALPYPVRLSWDLKTTTKKMRVHKLIEHRIKAVFNELLTFYGLAEIQRLGIDIFGGGYVVRPMRGGTEYSRHSWAIAFDFHPEKNQLKWGKDKALFAQPEYKPMHEIFYKHGFLSLGIEKNFDWMHFETAI